MFSNMASLLNERPDLRDLAGIIDNSLLGDLKAAIFGKEETYLYADLDESNSDISSSFAEAIRLHDSRLYFGTVFQFCQGSQGRVPYSYIIKELCELIELAKSNVNFNLESKPIRKFRADREIFWEEIFGSSACGLV
jgi:hypothetical protein